MLLKILITVCFLALFTIHTDACKAKRSHSFVRGLNGFMPRNFEYACPKSTKWVSSETSPDLLPRKYPFHVGTENQNEGQTVQHLTFVPVATRLFKILDMKVLPSREVCILGEKLSSFILPEDFEFETMFSIAIFCSSCIQEELQSKRSHCLEQKLRSIEWANTMKLKSLSEFFVATIAHELITKKHEHLEK
jgi:hypothetical protein